MRFDDMPIWFTGLSPEQDLDVRAAWAAKAPSVTGRLLPYQDGDTQEGQWRAGKERFLKQPEPFSLVRIGDFELGLLGGLFFPFGKPSNCYATMFTRAGYAPEAFPMRGRLIEAVRQAELLGLMENWDTQRLETAGILAMLDVEVPSPRGVEVHLPYYLLVDGTLLNWLSGRRVLLLGHLAPLLEDAWKRPAFHAAYERFGPSSKVKIVGSVPTTSRDHGGAWKDLDAALRSADRNDYDVALVAAGTTGKPLTYGVRKLGRTALDVGFTFDAILGTRPEAMPGRAVFRDVQMPAPTWW